MTDIENIELDLLTEAIFRKYGYDFRDYAYPSLSRRVSDFLRKYKFNYISEVIPKVLRNDLLFEKFISTMSVSVTEMFRDPQVYKAFRTKAIPTLKTFPRINIWHAGCCTGEEVYSFAIMLKEEGLYDRATIYATDIDNDSIEKAREGIYPIENIKQGTENYLKSGGKCAFSDYYHAKYGKVLIDKSLKEHITFSTHNLVNDGIFNQMHLIICRNVLIYFNKELQNHVLTLFSDSLIHNGILLLGNKESLDFSKVSKEFEVISGKNKVFRKKGVIHDR